ncbi:glycosyltransferase family 2 protein [Methanocella arvoryzae]|uniref:Glycosyltransferase (Family 2) n=1 Tax=Methanocella arvoryzae (strain DSM 22066 / NBRC 105507 / MRE50) TaxID=351160 RepID=Q0W811_METAR|nr:glycosyltransferase family 2 protein [Methanocella arvoryzae]CAJ35482.1 putative glycosyltransferase (family 2) [Methanocella arvoryzae MRE50]
MPPQVAIVILNWNNGTVTVDCLRSLEKLSYSNFFTLVLDNGSTDDSLEILHRAYPGISVVQNDKNLGFAGGNNPGIRLALEQGADYVLLLNNDTEVAPDFLDELIKVAEADPKIGIASAKIYYYSEPDRLWFAGGKVNYWKGWTQHLGDLEKDVGQYDHTTDTDFVSGCAMLIRREVIEKIGVLYEPFFLYYEDSDYCSRARRAGYRIVMAPKAKVWHKVSSTTGKIKDLQLFYGQRNMLAFERRNASPVRLAFFLPYYFGKFVAYNSLRALLSGNSGRAKLIWKAALEGLFI